MSENLKAWDALARPPKEALKKITGGRLSGMTDINPTWRMKVMTEQYGPCGVGWHYTIDGFDKHEMAGEVALLARITLYVAGHEHGIPGVGGSMIVAQEKSGLRLSDEAWKMAVTDALSVAMKALGVGAEVYMGNWDGSTYRNVAPTTIEEKIVAANVRPNAGAGDGLSEDKKDMIADIALALSEKVKAQDDYGIVELTETLVENEEKLFLWTLLSSAERRYIKNAVKEQKALDCSPPLASQA